MIFSNANLLTMQLGTKVGEKIGCASTEISQEKDRILWFNMNVPIRNQFLIHFIDRLEGTSSIADDVGMKKMGIRYEPFIHF